MWHTMSQRYWIMSHTCIVIQRVIGEGDDNIKKEGSPNDKLWNTYQTSPEGSPNVTGLLQHQFFCCLRLFLFSVERSPLNGRGHWVWDFALILWVKGADYVPVTVYGVPGDLYPASLGKMKLHRVKVVWSCGVIDEVPSAISYRSPPSCS